jgi:general secretion pathway protein G
MRPILAHPHRRPQAFSLLEILIVLMILGILAALVVPQFSDASNLAKESSLRDELRYLRTQIMVYRAQHGGVAPGYPNGNPKLEPTNQAFAAQLTRYSNAKGQTADAASAEFHLGPYLQRVPVNPINGSSAVRFLGSDEPFPSAPVGEEGWLYKPSTGVIAANVPGQDVQGGAYFDY